MNLREPRREEHCTVATGHYCTLTGGIHQMRITDFFIDWFLMVFTLPVPVFFVICFIIALFIPEIAFIADKISRFLKRVTRRQD